MHDSHTKKNATFTKSATTTTGTNITRPVLTIGLVREVKVSVGKWTNLLRKKEKEGEKEEINDPNNT